MKSFVYRGIASARSIASAAAYTIARHDVAVGVHGDADAGVAELLLHDLGRRAHRQLNGRPAVPQVVHAHRRNARPPE